MAKGKPSDSILLKLVGNPFMLFLTMIGAIFAVETVIMVILPRLPEMPAYAVAFFDALVLSITVLPILYFLSLKPMQRNILARRRTEIEREKALEFDRMKSEFISTAAHELLTPITSVMGYTELLLSGEPSGDEEEKEYLSVIMEKSEVLGRIVHDMLDLSRIESGQTLGLEKECQSLVPVIEEDVESYRRIYPRYRIETDLPEGTISLFFDRVRIGQVLRNLLSNAVKYSPEGSRILVLGEVREDQVLLQVRDEGIGMTHEQAAHAFDRFYRADATDTAEGGLGLGMAIAKGVVDAHGGSISLESEPGRGTTVGFSLPLPGKEGPAP